MRIREALPAVALTVALTAGCSAKTDSSSERTVTTTTVEATTPQQVPTTIPENRRIDGRLANSRTCLDLQKLGVSIDALRPQDQSTLPPKEPKNIENIQTTIDALQSDFQREFPAIAEMQTPADQETFADIIGAVSTAEMAAEAAAGPNAVALIDQADEATQLAIEENCFRTV